MNPRSISIPLVLLLALAAWPAAAQTPSDSDLLNGRPFDLIVLKPSQGSAVQRAVPLPNRTVPSPFPGGWLKVRLVNQPGKEYEVAWGDIARIELFEQMLLSRGQELSEQGEFNQAFRFFARLHNEYPEVEGLTEATEAYLLKNADQAFRDKQHDLALALLLSINDRYPDSPTLGRAVDAVGGKLIKARVTEQDFRGARAQLDILAKQFGNLKLTLIDSWNNRFLTSADARANKARQFLDAGDLRGARSEALRAITVWPDHRASLEVLTAIDKTNPLVLVGVTTPAPVPSKAEASPRLDARNALRTAPVLSPTVSQLVGYSQEGGRYGTPLGTIALDDTGRYLEILATGDQTPFSLSRWLTHATDASRPEYQASLAGVVSSIRVDAPDRVVVSLSRSFFRPEALLKDVSLASAAVDPPVRFDIVRHNSEGLIFQTPVQESGQTVTVEEVPYPNEEEALSAISSGAIDLLAEVPPWRVEALRESRGVTVGRYRLPKVHVLIPTKHHPLLDEREFRRALLYGINRERILNEVVLGKAEFEGFRVISGPFPYGVSLADPVHYGYNDAVEPRPFEPRLSVILSAVAWTNLQKHERGEEDPADDPLPALKLAHSSNPFDRTACQAIQLQLESLGYTIELLELSETELLAENPDFDLRYAELAMWEPAVDADRLLGPEGLAGRCSDPMRAALEQLYQARNTKEVQLALFQVHRLAHGDLPVLPLWQTLGHFAYRDQLSGAPASPVSLYGSATQWRKKTTSNARRSF